MGQSSTCGLCNLPDFLRFSFEIVEVFFLRLDIILAAFGGKGREAGGGSVWGC